MPNSLMRDFNGTEWPLGNILVPVPGTPVNIMSVVDPGLGGNPGSSAPSMSGEYQIRGYQLVFQPGKPGAGPHGLTGNTGNVYLVRQGVGAGTGNRDDYGAIIMAFPLTVAPNTIALPITWPPSPSPLSMNTINPYRYFLDADVGSEGAQVTLLIAG
jgi:hypothetical protein